MTTNQHEKPEVGATWPPATIPPPADARSRDKWADPAPVTVTLGAASVVWDAGLILLAAADRGQAGKVLTNAQKADRDRLVAALVHLGRQLGVPEGTLSIIGSGRPVGAVPSWQAGGKAR